MQAHTCSRVAKGTAKTNVKTTQVQDSLAFIASVLYKLIHVRCSDLELSFLDYCC